MFQSLSIRSSGDFDVTVSFLAKSLNLDVSIATLINTQVLQIALKLISYILFVVVIVK